MSEGRSGMSMDEFSQLNPDEVAALCGGATPAEDGPNPGTAGEQEAVMADEEHLTDPADGTADEAAEATPPAPRRIQLRASHLTERLMETDPLLDEASALELLEEILNEDLEEGEERQAIRNGNQFVSNTLASAVDRFIGEQPAQPAAADGAALQPFDQDAPSASAPDSDPADSGETPPSPEPEATADAPAPLADGEPQLDSYREPLRPYLQVAADARLRGNKEAAEKALGELAIAIYQYGWSLYEELGIEDELEIERYLFQLKKEEGQGRPESLTREELEQDAQAELRGEGQNLAAKAWFNRQAVRSAARVAEGTTSVQKELEDFTWPNEVFLRDGYERAQRRSARRSAFVRSGAVPPPRPASEEPASSTTDDTAASEPETGVASSGVPKELEGPPTQPVPVIGQRDGHRTVSSSDAPEPQRHVVQGGGKAAMRPAPKAPAAGRQSSGPVEEPDAQQPQNDGPADIPDRDTSRGKRKSDESFLVELPDEVFEAAVKAVIEDPDPEQCWAHRTPESVRAEAERRILVESGRQSAA